MSDLEAKCEEIATMIAIELGLGDVALLGPTDRATVDRQTADTIEGCRGEGADRLDANVKLVPLLVESRDLQQLRSDEDNTRLAERGEVFAREDDA